MEALRARFGEDAVMAGRGFQTKPAQLPEATTGSGPAKPGESS
jgi:hypothetical protein